jgi:hypothetical protein
MADWTRSPIGALVSMADTNAPILSHSPDLPRRTVSDFVQLEHRWMRSPTSERQRERRLARSPDLCRSGRALMFDLVR